MSFESNLLPGIPFDEAADYFHRLRGRVKEASLEEKWAKLTPEEQDEILKEATSSGLVPPTATLPATAQGQNMPPVNPTPLPPTAQGQHKMAEGKTPKERAHEQIEIAHEKYRHSSGERAGKHIGTLLGGAAGAAAGRKAGHGLAGAAMGALAGRAIGRDIGEGRDVKKFEKNFKHAAAKLAWGDGEGAMSPESEIGNTPDVHQYLASEELGQQAEQANADGFYREKFQQAMQQMQAMQEQLDQTNAMSEQLQNDVSGSQSQIQAAMQQAQMASQAAMQNVQQAHDMAMASTQQAMEAQSEVLRQKQLASAMRMGITQVKDQVMNALAQDPTDALAQQLTSPPPGSAGMVGGPSAGAQDPNAAAGGGMQNPSTAAAQNPDPNAQAGGDPSASGSSPPQAGAQSQTNSPSPGEEGEGASDGNSGKSKSEGSSSSSKGSTKVEIKQAAAKFAVSGKWIKGMVEGAKTHPARLTNFADKQHAAAMGSDSVQAIRKHITASDTADKKVFGRVLDRSKEAGILPPLSIPGALVGGAVGALGGAVESKMSNDKLRQKATELGAMKERSFAKAFDLSQTKARLALGEFAEEHPVANTAMTALGGAAMGATAGPSLDLSGFGDAAKNFRQAFQNLRG